MLKVEGKTILLISHNYTDIEQLCDTVYTIVDGALFPVTAEIAAQYKEANGEIR